MSEPPTYRDFLVVTESDVLGRTELQQLARRALAQHAGSVDSAEALSLAARRAYEDLAGVSTPLIGRVGVEALIARALHLAQQEHSWLADARRSADTAEPFASVLVSLARQNPAIATEGAAAVLATFASLLVTFIGESLTASLLRKAWPGAFSVVHTRES